MKTHHDAPESILIRPNKSMDLSLDYLCKSLKVSKCWAFPNPANIDVTCTYYKYLSPTWPQFELFLFFK